PSGLGGALFLGAGPSLGGRSHLGLEALGLFGGPLRGLGFFRAAAVGLGQRLLLGEVALFGFLQLAQDLRPLVGRRGLVGIRTDNGHLLAHQDIDRRAALAATDRQLLLPAAEIGRAHV